MWNQKTHRMWEEQFQKLEMQQWKSDKPCTTNNQANPDQDSQDREVIKTQMAAKSNEMLFMSIYLYKIIKQYEINCKFDIILYPQLSQL